ncbi:MAG: hypothetical protein ABW162_06500 [Candidatus Sedimenticola sp. PURPLELP]
MALKSSIEARIDFSYKGENYALSAKVDLDGMMSGSGAIHDLHRLLAMESKVDTYSYMYEVMEMQEVTFDNAEGLATECLTGGSFDIPKFEQLWKEHAVVTILAPIAKSCLGVDDLEQSPDLKAALVAAYEAGKLS